MKRLIIAILSLTILHGGAFAANCTATTQQECHQTPGCYWNNSTCKACPAGTYNDGTLAENATTCFSCGTTGTGVSWDSSKSGLTAQSECDFTANCKKFQFFHSAAQGCTACTYKNNINAVPPILMYSGLSADYSVNAASANKYSYGQVCKSCGANSLPDSDGLGCTCNTGYHVSGANNSETNNDSADCVINQYSITYKPNGGTGSQQTQIVNHGATFTLKPANIFYKTGHSIVNWLQEGTSTTYTPGSQLTTTNNLTLLAQWSPKLFSVTYETNSNTCTISSTQCKYDTTCTAASPSKNTCKNPGNIFTGWECTAGCGSTDKKFSTTDDISNQSDGQDMTLTALWEPCSAGYYCSDILTESKCPAGSTSEQGSAEKQKCHMTGGTTKFCDKNNKCFTLPASLQLQYQGSK